MAPIKEFLEGTFTLCFIIFKQYDVPLYFFWIWFFPLLWDMIAQKCIQYLNIKVITK